MTTNRSQNYLISMIYRKRLPGKREPQQVHVRASFAEGECRELWSYADLGHPQAYIRAQQAQEWRLDPTLLLHIFLSSPVHCLKGVPFRTDGIEVVDGIEAVRLTWEVDETGNRGSAGRGTYWVAPSLGYAVIRRERDRRPKSSMPWKLIELTESKRFQQVGDFWFPKEVHYSFFSYFPDGGYELRKDTVASFEGWKTNQNLPKNTFHLNFPNGTDVADFTKSQVQRYVVGQINDAQIAKEVASLRSPALDNAGLADRLARAELEEGDSRSRSSPRAWLAMTLASALGAIGVVCVLFWVRHRLGRGAR